MADRGVQIRMAYADRSMGRYDLRQHCRHVFADLVGSPGFRIDVVPGSDHLFTRVEAKQELTRHLLQLIDEILPGNLPAT